MTKRMLIDATHAEETRVVVLDGTRLEDFDVETSTKRQLKGNIYLAKVVRVEPSLQAAFVEYGGNRHGFLAFSEIHPDYYRIPVSDRRGDVGYATASDSASETIANGADDGVPIAAALPEPVPVPEGSSLEEEAEPEPDEVSTPAPIEAADAGPEDIRAAEPVGDAQGDAQGGDAERGRLDVATPTEPDPVTPALAEAETAQAPHDAVSAPLEIVEAGPAKPGP